MSQTIRQTNPLNEVKDQTYETTRIDLFIYDRILLYSIRSRHHCQYKWNIGKTKKIKQNTTNKLNINKALC